MSGPPRKRTARSSHDVGWMLLVGIIFWTAALGLYWWLDSRVEQSTPAGTVQRVTIASGFKPRLLVETETTYYPVYDLIAIDKGASVLLQQRASGDWYLCDAQAQTCGRTSGETLKTKPQKGTP